MSRRETKTPELIKQDAVHGDTYAHPAYGMISYGHISGGNECLVGSDIRHNHMIRFEIEEATKCRNLHSERFMPGKLLISVEMSDQQWATFIASPNTSGVPCTIRRRAPAGAFIDVPGLEFDSQHELAKAELKDAGNDLVIKLRAAIDRLQKLENQPSIKKQDFRSVVKEIYGIMTELTSNIPFHIEQHHELMESTVHAAKAEVQGYINDTIYRLGLEGLRQQAPAIEDNTAQRFWTFERDGNIFDFEFDSEKECQESADGGYQSECDDEGGWKNGDTSSTEIFLIEFYYNEVGERVETQRKKSTVDFEYYHGDLAEHGTIY